MGIIKFAENVLLIQVLTHVESSCKNGELWLQRCLSSWFLFALLFGKSQSRSREDIARGTCCLSTTWEALQLKNLQIDTASSEQIFQINWGQHRSPVSELAELWTSYRKTHILANRRKDDIHHLTQPFISRINNRKVSRQSQDVLSYPLLTIHFPQTHIFFATNVIPNHGGKVR